MRNQNHSSSSYDIFSKKNYLLKGKMFQLSSLLLAILTGLSAAPPQASKAGPRAFKRTIRSQLGQHRSAAPAPTNQRGRPWLPGQPGLNGKPVSKTRNQVSTGYPLPHLFVFKCDSRVTTFPFLFFLQCIKDYWRKHSHYVTKSD